MARPANNWVSEAFKFYSGGTPFVICTLWSLQGTSPDMIGSRVLVSATATSGHFNGSHRHSTIVAHAKALLIGDSSCLIQSYPLGKIAGAANGTCSVVYSVCDQSMPEWLLYANQRLQDGTPIVVAQSIDESQSTFHVFSKRQLPTEKSMRQCVLQSLDKNEPQQNKLLNTADQQTLLELIIEPHTTVVVVGDSKVAIALTKQLALLPIRIIWMTSHCKESAQDQLIRVPLQKEQIATLPENTCIAIATGDHDLDMLFCKLALEKKKFRYVGCVGSRRKAEIIKDRLQQEGIDHSQIAQLHMPIGLASIVGKQPEIVAASIVAQLLSLHATPGETLS